MEPVVYLRFVAALCLVLGLILGLMWLLRRFGPSGLGGHSFGTKRRLRVVESLQLDAKHRLVLVSSDDHEHLVLLGASGQVLQSRPKAGEADGAKPPIGEMHAP